MRKEEDRSRLVCLLDAAHTTELPCKWLVSLLLDERPCEQHEFRDYIALCRVNQTVYELMRCAVTEAQIIGYDAWRYKWGLCNKLHGAVISNVWDEDSQRCSVRVCTKRTGKWIPWHYPGTVPDAGMTCSSVDGSMRVASTLNERHHGTYSCVFGIMPTFLADRPTYVTCSHRCYRYVEFVLGPLMCNPIHFRATTEHHGPILE